MCPIVGPIPERVARGPTKRNRPTPNQEATDVEASALCDRDRWINWRTHRWSGWPDAWCLDCGRADPMGLAISSGDYLTAEHAWLSEEAKRRYDWTACPGSGDRVPLALEKIAA